MFGNIGLPEMILIMTVALIVFGPKKLPEIGRTLGKAVREFKKSTEDIKTRFEEQIKMDELKDIRDDLKDIKSNLSDVGPLKDFREGLNDIKKDFNVEPDDKKIP